MLYNYSGIILGYDSFGKKTKYHSGIIGKFRYYSGITVLAILGIIHFCEIQKYSELSIIQPRL